MGWRGNCWLQTPRTLALYWFTTTRKFVVKIVTWLWSWSGGKLLACTKQFWWVNNYFFFRISIHPTILFLFQPTVQISLNFCRPHLRTFSNCRNCQNSLTRSWKRLSHFFIPGDWMELMKMFLLCWKYPWNWRSLCWETICWSREWGLKLISRTSWLIMSRPRRKIARKSKPKFWNFSLGKKNICFLKITSFFNFFFSGIRMPLSIQKFGRTLIKIQNYSSRWRNYQRICKTGDHCNEESKELKIIKN